jgi:hypothetical protein
MKSDIVDLTVILKRRTERAVLVDHGGAEQCWLPLSQIEIEPNSDGKTYTVTLPQWLAEEKRMV